MVVKTKPITPPVYTIRYVFTMPSSLMTLLRDTQHRAILDSFSALGQSGH